MAANLPMAANGQLMMQQQQQHQLQSQQSMQQRQLHNTVFQQLANSQQLAPPGGWQSSLTLNDRLAKTLNLSVAFFVPREAGHKIHPLAQRWSLLTAF
jgi:hypothetical protein